MEAAKLYEKGGLHEKAAALYIQLKMFNDVHRLLKSIKSFKLCRLLGKSKEAEGKYADAEMAYLQAEDWENVIRVNIKFLDNLDKAIQVLRERCPTSTCAEMVASKCEQLQKVPEAIEFKILAGQREDAFNLAQKSNMLEVYATFCPEDCLRIATTFEGDFIIIFIYNM